MKILIWTVFALLALFWTGGTWLATLLVSALTDALAAGGTLDWAAAVRAWQLPAWLQPWIDGAAFTVMQGALAWLLGTVDGAAPQVAPVVGWLVPLLWGVWAFGLLALAALAGGLHWLVGRLPSGPGGPAVVGAA